MAGLASERMHHILKEAAEQFDWVILDTAPVGLITDANLMAGFVDGVIFVIGANSTNYQLVERSLNEIGRDRIIGTVLNRVEHDTTPAGGYYNHYYHDPESSEDA
jgi:Mrp family chromosome partitioning ATPase